MCFTVIEGYQLESKESSNGFIIKSYTLFFAMFFFFFFFFLLNSKNFEAQWEALFFSISSGADF